MPHAFVQDGYRGYLEDRRPNSQGDPYRIAGRILQTIQLVAEPAARANGNGVVLTSVSDRVAAVAQPTP